MSVPQARTTLRLTVLLPDETPAPVPVDTALPGEAVLELCEEGGPRAAASDAAAAMEADWALAEFGAAYLGDPRRTARLVQVARALGQRPSASLPEACPEPADLEGAYRFFANETVTPEAILASHLQATYRRLAAVPLVLAVNDTTMLDYTSHPSTLDLGPLNSVKQQGMLLHGTLAITPERVPLGVLAADVWVRDGDSFAQRDDYQRLPIAEKESRKWLDSLDATRQARAACPPTRFVSVGDREADVYDLFVAPRGAGGDLLVRARHNRGVLDESGGLQKQVAPAPVVGHSVVHLRARPGQAPRDAHLTVRSTTLTLTPPKNRSSEGLPPVTLVVVEALEEHPPAGVKPLHWRLLPSVPVGSGADALTCLAWYACRWGIELWHKVLKSGCGIEDRQLQTQARPERLLTVCCVVGWRLLWGTFLARTTPHAPATLLLQPAEWQALTVYATRTPQPPPTPPTIQQAVQWLAELGGYRRRRRDGPPGATVLWRGYLQLAALTSLYQTMNPSATEAL